MPRRISEAHAADRTRRPPGRATKRALWLPFALSAAACGPPDGLPSARFSLEPQWLCEGDDSSSVILDATGSLAADGQPSEELEYAWTLAPEPVEWVRGTEREPRIIVRFAALGPVSLRLEISDAAGGWSRSNRVLGVTRTTPVPCEDDASCEAHEICARFDGLGACVDDMTCSDDDACGCLVCAADDEGVSRCR